MSDHIATIIAIVAIFFGLPLALLLARDRVARPSREKIEEESRRFAERLGDPDFAAVEKHFGCPLPDCVLALYADSREFLRGDFEVAPGADTPEDERWFVSFYLPADGESVRDGWPGLERYFAFADDGSGNSYLIDPREADPPVLFHDHESGKVLPVCNRFTEFMRWPRLEVDG